MSRRATQAVVIIFRHYHKSIFHLGTTNIDEFEGGAEGIVLPKTLSAVLPPPVEKCVCLLWLLNKVPARRRTDLSFKKFVELDPSNK